VVPLEAGDGKPLLVEGPADAWSSQGGALLFEDSTFGTIRLHRSTEEVVRYQVTFRDPACRGAIVVRGETHAFNVGVSGEISKAFPDVSLRADAPCEGAFQMSFGGFAPSRAPTHPATVPDVA
jgi:hypothetical protein